MKRTIKKEFQIGLLLFALYLILYRFTDLPHIVLGIVFGLSMGAYIVGLLPDAAKAKIKAFKLSLIGKKQKKI